MPHLFNFMVVRRSMQTRYFIEIAFFFCLVSAFQMSLSDFTTDFNETLRVFFKVSEIEAEIYAIVPLTLEELAKVTAVTELPPEIFPFLQQLDPLYAELTFLFPRLVKSMGFSFTMSVLALIMPAKMILFSLHNYLTKRDYTYSIDDISDLAIAICVSVWIGYYVKYSAEAFGDPT